jgi:hypothetical protein
MICKEPMLCCRLSSPTLCIGRGLCGCGLLHFDRIDVTGCLATGETIMASKDVTGSESVCGPSSHCSSVRGRRFESLAVRVDDEVHRSVGADLLLIRVPAIFAQPKTHHRFKQSRCCLSERTDDRACRHAFVDLVPTPSASLCSYSASRFGPRCAPSAKEIGF